MTPESNNWASDPQCVIKDLGVMTPESNNWASDPQCVIKDLGVMMTPESNNWDLVHPKKYHINNFFINMGVRSSIYI